MSLRHGSLRGSTVVTLFCAHTDSVLTFRGRLSAVKRPETPPWSVPLQPPVRGGREVDPGRTPRCRRVFGTGVPRSNYRQLPANPGRVWQRPLTSLSGQKAAGGHLEVESDSRSYFTSSCCGFWFLLLTPLTSCWTGTRAPLKVLPQVSEVSTDI